MSEIKDNSGLLMDILYSTDMGICYLAAKASADFIKVEEKKAHPKKQRKKILYCIYHFYSYFLVLLSFYHAHHFYFLWCLCPRSNAMITEQLIGKNNPFKNLWLKSHFSSCALWII